MRIHSARDLALVIADRRKKLGLSQTQAGNLVGILQKTLSAFETKPENTKLDTFFRILSAMQLELQIIPKEKKEKSSIKWNEEW